MRCWKIETQGSKMRARTTADELVGDGPEADFRLLCSGLGSGAGKGWIHPSCRGATARHRPSASRPIRGLRTRRASTTLTRRAAYVGWGSTSGSMSSSPFAFMCRPSGISVQPILPIYRPTFPDVCAELETPCGPFTPEEAVKFRRHTHADAAIALRRHDEQAKIPGLVTPALGHFRPHLEEVDVAQRK